MMALTALSCAPIPKGSPDLAARALRFSPDPGRAAVYVVRPAQFTGGLAPLPVFLDHAKLGAIMPKAFLYAEVLPREHILELAEFHAANSTSTTFKAEEGQCYFYEARVVLGGTRLTLLHAEEGRQRIGESTLSGDSAGQPGPAPLIPVR